jgi:putative Mn2+ efflux pump MntP
LSPYNQQQISNGSALNNVTNQALVSIQFGDAITDFVGGVILFIVGLVLMIIGFKNKEKVSK